jgi:hypothetical protein
VPELTLDQLTTALAVVAGVALLSFLFALIAMIRLRKARREYMVLRGDKGERDVLSAVGRSLRSVGDLQQRLDGVVAAQEEQSVIGRFALQRFAIVRYDAFEDMGGQLSFSAALLDEHGDGLVITSINGRTETRTYAKSVHKLQSKHNLSGEEQAAIDNAASGVDRAQPATAAIR